MTQVPNHLQKQIQASMDQLKSQPIITDIQLQSKEPMNKVIKQYQSRVSEMLKIISKQKKQNETLKQQFKKLNDQLSSTLLKMQSKIKVQQQVKSNDSRLQLMKKELQNQIKKNSILKKQIDQIKYKDKYLQGHKVDDLKNQIKQKDRLIEELINKIKLYQKIEKWEKNTDSYKKQEELTQKISKQNQEIIHLKKKQTQMKKSQEQLQKTIKTLRQQILTFQTKIATIKSQPKTEQKHKQLLQASQSDLQKLNQKFKHLQNAKKQSDRANKQQIDTLVLKIKTYQRQLSQVKDKIQTKDKESNILMLKLKERERKNFNTLEPIKTIRYSQEILHNSNMFQARKEYKGLGYSQGVYRQFDDSKFLPLQKNYKIKRIEITSFEEHILSWTTQYQILDNEHGKQSKKQSKVLSTFAIPAQYNNIKYFQYVFSDYQNITNVTVYAHKFIEFIRIQTSKEEIIEIGNSKSIPRCKQSNFQIKTNQKPICFMGVIQNKKIGELSREYLISFGLQLRRKEVFLRNKNAKRSQSSAKKSQYSQSFNVNDKNKP